MRPIEPPNEAILVITMALIMLLCLPYLIYHSLEKLLEKQS